RTGDHLLDSLVQERDKVRKSVAKKTTDADSHVNARPTQFFQRDDLHSHQAPVFTLPHGTHAKQREDLGHVIAVRAHGARSPNADADALRISAVLFYVASETFAGQLLTDLPCRR